MTAPYALDRIVERYPCAFAQYDRQSIWHLLTEALSTWQVSKAKRYRLLYMCRLTLDTLDTCDGKTLQDRWRFFEVHHLPQWRQGQRNPVMVNTWTYGIRVLVLTRLVLPSWGTLYQSQLQVMMKSLPDSDTLKHEYLRLKQAVESQRWATYPVKRSLAVDRGLKLMLVNGYRQLEEIQEQDITNQIDLGSSNYVGVGADILDGALCSLGVFKRTPRRNSSRRLRQEQVSIADIITHYKIPSQFCDVTQRYLETALIRFGWTTGHLRHVCHSIAQFWIFCHTHYPEIKTSNAVLPKHGQAFIDATLQQARTKMHDPASKGIPSTIYGYLLGVRTFFLDLCTWAAEPQSIFVNDAPRIFPFSRNELSRAEFNKSRKETAERLKATIFDLERELPKIRAYALHEWLTAENQLKANPQSTSAIDTESDAFWNWALLELLLQSGLRVEEATELTTLDILKRHLTDGRIYYVLHIKPSKFDRARLIPIGDGLGRVIAEVIRHVKAFYQTQTVPFCDRWDFTARKKSPRAPYLLQGVNHPSVISDEVVRRRLRSLSRGAGAKTASGDDLTLHPHDCRRMFATEHLNNNLPVHVIQALLGHATLNTVMVYAKLYPHTMIEEYRKALRGIYNAFHGEESFRNPTREEWAKFEESCSLRDMGTHVCALPTGEHCPRGLICLGCTHAQPKRNAIPVFQRMLSSHERELARAQKQAEPAGQLAAREMEIDRIRRALRRAQELTDDVAAAIEASATP